MPEKTFPENIYDILIIGGGPAGLTAGIYAARAGMKTLMTESLSVMGQATMTDLIENYPGIDQTGGFELVSRMKEQAKKFGLECRQDGVERISSRMEGDVKVWQASAGKETFEALTLVVATGASPGKLGVPGEEELCGKGVSYCATCDGAFFREKDIAVVGGGNTAIQEALFLTKFARKVTVIHRRDRLRAVKVLADKADANDKIEFIWSSVVEEILGSGKVENLRIKNVKTEEVSSLHCDGIFIFTGWKANTKFLEGLLKADESGLILVDENMSTSEGGIFACGDCCKRPLQQVITACGDGAIAAESARIYVEELKGIAYK